MDLLVDGINYGIDHIIDGPRHLMTSLKIIERKNKGPAVGDAPSQAAFCHAH